MKKETISIFGLGYVGLTTAICFAHRGFKVIGVDVNADKVELINNGKSPFYEPKIEKILQKALEKRLLSCTQDQKKAIKDSDITFITVGTPNNPDGSINLKFVKSASESIGKTLRYKGNYHLVVVKSTVVPGTTEKLVKPSIEKQSHKRCGSDFGLCMNPEFLGEGTALHDTFNPNRIVIGEYNKKSGDILESLYKKFHSTSIPPIIRTNLQNAELIKYASNAFLAMKISFINQMANLCQRIPNADVNVIAEGIGLDKRIGPLFLKAGLGWGGSCFPKDLKALLRFSRSKGTSLPLTEGTLLINETQPLKAVKFAEKLLSNLKNKKIAILGLSFKPETDDMRNAVSTKIIKELLRRKAKIVAYDPTAMKNAKKIFGTKIEYSKSALECIRNTDCAIVVTEWPEFSKLKPEDFTSKMRKPVVIDGRRIYNPKNFSQKLKYVAIGLGSEMFQPEPDETIWINPALTVNVIIENKGKILLIKRRLHPFKDLWSLPGGYVEYGETIENAARREIKEECGLNIQLSRIVGVYSNPKRHPWKHVIATCYTAKIIGGKIKTESREGKAKFFELKSIPKQLAFDHTKMIKDYLTYELQSSSHLENFPSP
jgi:UDPglucose 6-dehydrogenase